MPKINFSGNEKILFHCIVATLAIAIAICGLVFAGNSVASSIIILLIQTLILILLCITHVVSVINYSKCKHNCNRIKTEYVRVVNKQTYKLNRLSQTEQQLLHYILHGYRINELTKHMHLNTFSLFQQVNCIRQKLEIPVRESPFDVDWKSILG